VADGLDHFHRYQLVVLAVEVAVIVQPERDAVRQARGIDARAGTRVLLA
jgi:hypothetical protein